MRIHWIKIIATAVTIEIAAILTLVCVVAIFGPQEIKAAQDYAERVGLWVGPLAGITFCFGGALWIARPLKEGHLIHGILLGFTLAAVDVILLLAMRAPFEWILFFSDIGKIFAGSIGGALATYLSKRALQKAEQGAAANP